MAIYDEEYEYEDNSVLDNMIEACSNMIDMIDESTAAQRYYGTTTKDMLRANDSYRKLMSGYKVGGVANKVQDKAESSKKLGERSAATAGKYYHDGKYDDKLNKAINIGIKAASKYEDEPLSDRQKEDLKVRTDAINKAAVGAELTRMHKSGADIKGAYNKAAEKAEAKKKAVKEACLYILSRLDDIE